MCVCLEGLATNEEGVGGGGDELTLELVGVEAGVLLVLEGVVEVGGDTVGENLALAPVGLVDGEELRDGAGNLSGVAELGEDLEVVEAKDLGDGLLGVDVDSRAIEEADEVDHAGLDPGVLADSSVVNQSNDSSGYTPSSLSS